MEEQSYELLQRWQNGDESAADELFRRYFSRLHALVQVRLSQRLAARLDAEDVVQSALLSFFTQARDGRFVLKQAGDLWRLLAAITINKMRHVERRHSAEKRAVDLERLPPSLREGLDEETAWLAHEPTPEEAATLDDELESLLRPLHNGQRRIVELRLQGYTLDEIAVEVHLSQRTVRRTMEQVKQHLENRLRECNEL
ncbi:MAG TPA: sigma-70 family RNA polymerase sigma factor [Gemmataceae bacterium]|nr:sigma-70 family RNA polymerase sigma factor [Gemmataceae bacterium]